MRLNRTFQPDLGLLPVGVVVTQTGSRSNVSFTQKIGLANMSQDMASRQDQIDQLVEFVNKSGKVSVSDIADELDISHSYAYSLAMDAMEEDRIDGDRNTPVIGYVFERNDDDSDLEVLTSRKGLLWAVKKYAPERLSEARSKKTLKSLRRFVRNQIADGTVPVNWAWRLYPA